MAENEWEQKGIRFATNGKRRNTFRDGNRFCAQNTRITPLVFANDV
jgi:hypothetical protein